MEAWNNSQVFYLSDLSKAFGELFSAKSFKRQLEGIEHKGTKDPLENLLRLYILTKINRDMALFRENDYFTGNNSLKVK
jgi:hypothetical protein